EPGEGLGVARGELQRTFGSGTAGHRIAGVEFRVGQQDPRDGAPWFALDGAAGFLAGIVREHGVPTGQPKDREYHCVSSSCQPALRYSARAAALSTVVSRQMPAAPSSRAKAAAASSNARATPWRRAPASTYRSLRIHVRAMRTDEYIGYSWTKPTIASPRRASSTTDSPKRRRSRSHWRARGRSGGCP